MTVDGSLGPDDVWIVRGVVTNLMDPPAAGERPTVAAEACLELTMGVVREALRGRDRGARRLQVTLSCNHGMEGFLLGMEPVPTHIHAA